MTPLRPIETRTRLTLLRHVTKMRSLGNEGNAESKLVFKINREDRSHRSQRSYVLEFNEVCLRPKPAADLFLGREDVSQGTSR
jgi:hypothetical protein